MDTLNLLLLGLGVLFGLWFFTADIIIYEPRKRHLILFFGIPIFEVCKEIGEVDTEGNVTFTPTSFWHRLPFYILPWPFSKWKEKDKTWKVFSDKAKIEKKEYLTLDEQDAPEGETEFLALGSDTWSFLLREEVRGLRFNTVTTDGGQLALRIIVIYVTLSLKENVNAGVKDWDETVAAARIEDILGRWSRTNDFNTVMSASNETSQAIEVDSENNQRMRLVPFLSKELAKYGIAVGNLNFRPPKILKVSQDRLDKTEEVKLSEMDVTIAENQAKAMKEIGNAEAAVLKAKLGEVTTFRKENAPIVDETDVKVAEHWSKLPGTYVNIGGGEKSKGIPEFVDNIAATLTANIISEKRKESSQSEKKGGKQ